MTDKTQQPNKPRRRAKQETFLAALSQTANICHASTVAGIDRRDHYDWLKSDPTYRARFEESWERGIDALESEASRRALEGVEEPVFSGGRRAVDVLIRDGKVVLDSRTKKPVEVPATVRRKSDTLLMFMLNGNRSKRYRNRSDNRFVDGDGKDRALDLASVRAYMQAANHDGTLPE